MSAWEAAADEAEVFDFLVEYERDVAAGKEPGLAHYLARFAGCADAVAREYLALRDEARPVAARAVRDGAPQIGPYLLIEELGRGGQGAVWLAEDVRIARRVALKMLPPSYAALSSERRERMRREAALVSRLDHRGICPVYEAEVDGEHPYIAMRYVAGETLAARIRRAREGGACDEPLSPAPRSRPALHHLLRFFERAARALHAAHEAGVLHRDVKPGNLMVDPAGEPVVVDFGQAREEHFDGAALTLTGELFGTPSYMAPEQVEGRGVDRRTDVWALGATLYEALTLRSPFQRASVPRTLAAIRDEPAIPPSAFDRSIPAELDVVVATALEKDVARRYPSALEFAEDLRRLREYEPIRARPAGAWLRLRRWARREPALAAVFVTLSLGLVGSLYLHGRERSALRFALGRHLADRAEIVLAEDPAAALALAIEAMERAPGDATRKVAYATLDACRMRSEFRGVDVPLVSDLVVDPARAEVVIVGSDGALRTFGLEDGRELRRVALGVGALEALCVDFGRGLALTASSEGRADAWSWPELAPRATFDGAGGAPVALELDALRGRCVFVTAEGFAVWNLDGADSRVERATDRVVKLAALGPDGLRLALASRSPGDTTSYLALHELEGGERALELLVGAAPITSLAFDPLGEWLSCGDAAGVLRTFELATGAPNGPPVELAAPITSVRWSPDGAQLLVTLGGFERPGAWLFGRASGTRIELGGDALRPVIDADFAPDGSALVTLCLDRVLRIYSARDGRPLGQGTALIRPLSVAYSPDGRRILTRNVGNTVQAWYAGGLPELYALRGHAGPVRWAEFHPSGELAITASDDGTARVWRTPRDERSELGGETVCVLAGHSGPLRSAHFAAGGELALTIGSDASARLWQVPSGAPRGEPLAFDAQVIDFDRSADGTSLAFVTADGLARVVPLDGPAPPPIAAAVARARFTADGSGLLCACADGFLRRYRASDGALLAECALGDPAAPPAAVLALELRADGGELALVTEDSSPRFADPHADPPHSRLRFLDPLTGAPTRPEHTRLFPLRSLTWSPTGTQVLFVGTTGAGAYRLVDLAPAPHRRHEFNHRGDLTCGAYAPTGAHGLTASRDNTVFVFETLRGQPVSQLDLHSGAVLHATFAPDGGPLRVLTASEDGTARVWPVDPLPSALRRQPRELSDWEHAREVRLAKPLPFD